MTLMKSDAVSRPANVDVCVFHNGAETISELASRTSRELTVLNKTVESFLDEEIRVEQD